MLNHGGQWAINKQTWWAMGKSMWAMGNLWQSMRARQEGIG
jgi:hypothetical protein